MAATTAGERQGELGEGVDEAGGQRRARAQERGDQQHHGARHRGQRQHGEEVLQRLDRHGQPSMAGGGCCSIAWVTSGGMHRFRSPLVDAAWVRDHRDEIVLADVRWYLDGRSGPDAFAAGHLPGAVFVDLGHDLADHANTDPTRGRHPLPTPEAFAEAMGRLGIGDDTSWSPTTTAAVGRPAGSSGCCGRRVTTPRCSTAAWPAWADPLETGPSPARRPASFARGALAGRRPWSTPMRWPSWPPRAGPRCSTPAASTASAATPNRSTRAPATSRARATPTGRATSTRRPGSFLPPDVLRERFDALGVDRTAATSWPTAVRASRPARTWSALEAAGIGGARLYVASWSGWSADPDRPVATGDG